MANLTSKPLNQQSATRRKGVISFVHQDGRYGFIDAIDGTKLIFVHRNAFGMTRHHLQVGATRTTQWTSQSLTSWQQTL